MIILAIRTDKPDAEISLWQDKEQLAHETWKAHRQLSATIHSKIKKLLESVDKNWHDVEGIVCYIGPGSFTGLRIGITVANTLASTLNISIVGTNGDEWLETGVRLLERGTNLELVIPFYGRDPHTTPQKK